MVDMQSPIAENRRGKKKKKERKIDRNHRVAIITAFGRNYF